MRILDRHRPRAWNCTDLGIPDIVSVTVTPEGLFVTLTGLLLHRAPPRMQAPIASDGDGRPFCVRRNMKLGRLGLQGLEPHECDDLAVILGPNPVTKSYHATSSRGFCWDAREGSHIFRGRSYA